MHNPVAGIVLLLSTKTGPIGRAMIGRTMTIARSLDREVAWRVEPIREADEGLNDE